MITSIEKVIGELTKIARDNNKSYDEVFNDYNCLYKRRYHREERIRKEGQYLNNKPTMIRYSTKQMSKDSFNTIYMPFTTVEIIRRLYQ